MLVKLMEMTLLKVVSKQRFQFFLYLIFREFSDETQNEFH